MGRLLIQGSYGLVALILAATVAVFLRDVSWWSAMMVILVFIGMAVTFLLGMFAGSARLARLKKRSERPGILSGHHA